MTLFQLRPLTELACATDGAPSPACQVGPTGRCMHLSALGWGDRDASRSVRRADIYQAREGFWRYEGHFNESRASGCASLCAHLNIGMEHMYNEAGEEQKPHGEVDGEEKNKHTEEGEGRRRLDEAERKKITVELEKYSHPLNDQQPGVYNICNGQVAPAQ